MLKKISSLKYASLLDKYWSIFALQCADDRMSTYVNSSPSGSRSKASNDHVRQKAHGIRLIYTTTGSCMIDLIFSPTK